MIRYGDRNSSIDVEDVIKILGFSMSMDIAECEKWLDGADLSLLFGKGTVERNKRWYYLAGMATKSRYPHAFKNSLIFQNREPSKLDEYNQLLGNIHLEDICEDDIWQGMAEFAKNVKLYKRDLFCALYFNLDYQKSIKYDKKIIDNAGAVSKNIKQILTGGKRNQIKYYEPFDLNKLGNFCEYSWRSILKDSDSIEAFKTKKKNKYLVNSYIFDRIRKTISPPSYMTDPSAVDEEDINRRSVLPTLSDRWLIEKIYGTGTILSFFPAMSHYYDGNTYEQCYEPVFCLLMRCKPVYIRIALTDLICLYFSKLPKFEGIRSPFYSKANNDIYLKESILTLSKRIESLIDQINRNYECLLMIILTYCEKINIGKENLKDIFSWGSNEKFYEQEMKEDKVRFFKLLPQAGMNILSDELIMNRIGWKDLNDIVCKYPLKKTYHSGDPAWRYGLLQYEAIQIVKDAYRWSIH